MQPPGRRAFRVRQSVVSAMPLFLRRNEFEGEDYSVIQRDADGTEHDIGRIFNAPHQGVTADRESALAAFNGAGRVRTFRSTGHRVSSGRGQIKKRNGGRDRGPTRRCGAIAQVCQVAKRRPLPLSPVTHGRRDQG